MSAGKGDSPRSCFSREYRENFDAIFRKSRVERRESKASKLSRETKDERREPAVRTVSPHP